MDQKQNIIATFRSWQGEETTLLQYDGELFMKDKSFFIRYTEQTEEGEIRHLLRYQLDELLVTRKGQVQSEQIYRVGEPRSGYYSNQMISLEVSAHTRRLQLLDTESNVMNTLPTQLPFSLEWDYELFVNEQSSGRFTIRLEIQEAKV